MFNVILFNKYGRVVEDGQIIFREGDIGDKMYIIQEGFVKIVRKIAGKEHVLATFSKGDFFREMAIVRKVKRTATAIAEGEVYLLVFNKRNFIQMIEKNAKIAFKIIDKLCGRLEHANEQIQILVKDDVKNLIAMNIYYAMQAESELNYDKLTKAIATNMVIPVALVREKFTDFEEKKIISVSGNKITVLDIERLKM